MPMPPMPIWLVTRYRSINTLSIIPSVSALSPLQVQRNQDKRQGAAQDQQGSCAEIASLPLNKIERMIGQDNIRPGPFKAGQDLSDHTLLLNPAVLCGGFHHTVL